MIAALAAAAATAAASVAATSAAATSARPVIDYAEVVGSIDPGSAGYLLDSIKRAELDGAEALLVRLDTPGGLLSATRDVVQEELSAKVPIIFWVGPPGARAGSAGVFLTLAAHVAAMAPSTNIGAAHPVGVGGGGKAAKKESDKDEDDGAVMDRKVENDTAAFVQGIAERRSRNVEWAVQAVRESVSVTASKALELKVIDLIAEDVPELLRKIDNKKLRMPNGETRELHTAGAEVRELSWAVRDRVLHGIADPQIAYLIGFLGVLCILAELYHPGTVVPGVVGVICLLIAGVAFQMLPVRMGALALIAAAIALFVAEMKVGGHGGFILGGAVALTIGSLLLVGHVSPGFYADADFGISWKTAAPLGLGLGIYAFVLAKKLAGAHRQRPLIGGQELVGSVGEVREAVGPEGGRVLVEGELWSATSSEPLAVGSKAKVLSVKGLRLEVAAA